LIGLALPACAAAIAGFAFRRRCGGGGRFHFEWWELALAAFAVELLLYDPPVDSTEFALAYGPWVWVATRIVLLVAVMRNSRSAAGWSRACLLMAVGIALNTIVIAANGGFMPQSVSAAAAVWGQEVAREKPTTSHLQNTRPMEADSRLTWLGDLLPEPTWLPRANVLSVGDVLLAIGMAGWIFSNLRGVGATDSGGHAGSIADIELRKNVFDVGLHGLH
jgi:hypothetical protein